MIKTARTALIVGAGHFGYWRGTFFCLPRLKDLEERTENSTKRFFEFIEFRPFFPFFHAN